MSKKIFILCRIFIMIVVTIVAIISIQKNQWILPVITILTAMILIFLCKKRVKTVLVDERDYKLAEKSSRWAVSLYSIVGAIAGIILVALGEKNYNLYLIGNTILYSICFLILLGTIFYWAFSKKGE